MGLLIILTFVIVYFGIGIGVGAFEVKKREEWFKAVKQDPDDYIVGSAFLWPLTVFVSAMMWVAKFTTEVLEKLDDK